MSKSAKQLTADAASYMRCNFITTDGGGHIALNISLLTYTCEFYVRCVPQYFADPSPSTIAQVRNDIRQQLLVDRQPERIISLVQNLTTSLIVNDSTMCYEQLVPYYTAIKASL